MADIEKRFDAVFEGGGVKGIGLVGAYSVLEAKGYTPNNLAGTSAGAIVAALIAAGYGAAELREVLMKLDFRSFLDAPLLGRVWGAGQLLTELINLGLYKGNAFRHWLEGLLEAKNKRTFNDLLVPGETDPRYRFKLRVVAADLSRHKLLVLPDDSRDFGITPEDFQIAEAVRMSMSIPFFFNPIRRKASKEECYIVDGGVLSNFPVELFDSPGLPAWPTFGFRLVAGRRSAPGRPITGIVSMLREMIATMLQAHDARYLDTHAFVRTIVIDTLDVSTIDFGLDDARKEALHGSGVAAAEDFLRHWDFERYKELFRSGRPQPRRRDLVWAAI